MKHLLEELLSGQAPQLRGFVFGFVHATIMLLGYYTGFSINRLLKFVSNGAIAGITGAAIAHVVGDVIASLIDPHLRFAVYGIVVGGILPLFFIPIFEKFIIKSPHHIMTGDHEDIARDLDDTHR